MGEFTSKKMMVQSHHASTSLGTHCLCGQYLTKYLHILAKLMPEDSQMNGVPCPAENCDKTYTLQKERLDHGLNS
jgi:hypothetical protein